MAKLIDTMTTALPANNFLSFVVNTSVDSVPLTEGDEYNDFLWSSTFQTFQAGDACSLQSVYLNLPEQYDFKGEAVNGENEYSLRIVDVSGTDSDIIIYFGTLPFSNFVFSVPIFFQIPATWSQGAYLKVQVSGAVQEVSMLNVPASEDGATYTTVFGAVVAHTLGLVA